MQRKTLQCILVSCFTDSNRLWDYVSMDFILDFTKTQRQNRQHKMAHFIPCFKTSDATDIENQFFNKVVILHGLPKTYFQIETPYLWDILGKILWKKLRIDLNFI